MAAPRRLTRDHLTHEYVCKLLSYDKTTGVFTRLVSRQRFKAGERAGTPSSGGYRSIKIDGISIPENVLAWFIVTGSWPENLIDHRNGKRDDNRWDNLREATESQNRFYTPKYGEMRGITQRRRKNGDLVYSAGITCQGKRMYIGQFDSLEAAKAAWVRKARELFGEFHCQT